MEIDKMLKCVSNLNEYIAVSQKIISMPSNLKIHFNMSTILSLKKVRALEIEHFNKCEGNGAALLSFERMLKLPPSKSWLFLGKELALLLQYWLDAVRKHLIKHNQNWWNFLKLLLNFIQFMRAKDPSLPNILVEHNAECLLDLATGSEPDILQRLHILLTLNLCCRDCSRDTRKLLKKSFEPYFTKLSSLLASCGHWPTQCAIMETLMRWLLGRHELSVRQDAAPHWFPKKTFGVEAVELFLKRDFQNFYQDTRDFLNAHNDISDQVVSVVCRKASIGDVVISSSTDKRDAWLDVNCGDRSISVVVEPRLLEVLGCNTECLETLFLTEDTIQHVEISKDSCGVVLSVNISHAARLFPSRAEMNGRQFKAIIASKHVEKLDRALRSNYNHRYKLLLDLLTLTLSPQDFGKNTTSFTDEDTRFSHPIERRTKRSGYMVRSRNPEAWKSPSTASTSSLAQLHEKLAHLPRFNFDKEAVHVCALPELSTVTEVSETDERQSLASVSTIKLHRPYGVCQKNIRNEKNSQSDGELQKKPKVGRYLSPSANIDENSTSCLLVATVGSDESVINETLERFNKSKDFKGDNIVDLIVQEALNREQDKLLDSGINTGDNRKTQELENSEAIEDTLVEKCVEKNIPDCEKSCIVLSNSTTDESNDVVYDTPLNFVNNKMRKKELRENESVTVNNQTQVFDEQEVDNFFTEHLNENERGEVIISPTLARKINDSSSESEGPFDECLLNENLNINANQIGIEEIEIIECLNCMVDKVCSDLEKYTEIFDKNLKIIECSGEKNIESAAKKECTIEEISNVKKIITDCRTNHKNIDISNKENIEVESNNNLPFKVTTNINKNTVTKKENMPLKNITPKNTKKCSYPTKRIDKPRGNTKQKSKKLKIIVGSEIPPGITETQNATEGQSERDKPNECNDSPPNKSDYLNIPLARRKRKLYSPKEENIGPRQNKQSSEEEDHDFRAIKISTPRYKATSYKDIEEDRKKMLTKPRARKSSKTEPLSPRTKKNNDIFDLLKNEVDSNDSVILADKKLEIDLAAYNFTSDSEDEDFKKKKIEIQKRLSSTTIASADSATSTRRGRTVHRINYSERSSDDAKKNSVTRPKRTNRKKQTKRQQIKKEHNLLDEKMRKVASEELNTSLVIEKPLKKSIEEPKLLLNKRLEMEAIPDQSTDGEKHVAEKKIKKNKRTDTLSLKKEKKKNKAVVKEITFDDGTESSLPGLVVETIPNNHNDNNDSISANFLQNLQKIQGSPEMSINETQNLICDLNKIMSSPPLINVTDEFSKIEREIILNDTDIISNKKVTKSTAIVLKEPTSRILTTIKKEHSAQNNKQNNKQSTEIIEISCTSDVKSDESISTIGNFPIRAHGDSNESPPDPKLLAQNYEHRDIEMENLDEPFKDYFNKLRCEVYSTTKRNLNSSDSSPEISKDDSIRKNKLAVVSLSRLPIDDISKWLPSRRNSDTDSSVSVRETEQRAVNNLNTIAHSENNSDKNTHPITLGIENFDNIFSEINIESRNKSKTKPQKLPIVEITKNKSKISKLEESDSDNATDISIGNTSTKSEKLPEKSTKPIKWLRSHSKQNTSALSKAQNQETKERKIEASPKRKSIISPIKLFGDIFPSAAPDHSGDDDEENVGNVSNKRDKDKEINVSITSNLKETKRDFGTSSPLRKINTSTKSNIDSSNKLKRKSESLETGNAKKILLDNAAVAFSESEQSSSSVFDWFKKNTPMSRAENMNASFTEAIQNVMEKLDTTLAEIHQHTSKNFIHMFVDAQKRLATVKQERRQMFRTVAAEVLAEVVKLVDAKFADIDQRSEEMDTDFMKQLKTQALELIRDDCKRKQIMVSLLREDVQAVLDHMNKTQSENC